MPLYRMQREKILNDKKELSEHVTIVDLIRNDLSQVASDVQVTRFRYVDEIRTDSKTLLQVSSEIVGQLEGRILCDTLGDILVTLLPAGSVSGAPKPKTLEIIRKRRRREAWILYRSVWCILMAKIWIVA